MTRHEAYIEKNWERLGLAQLLVARIQDDGDTDFAMFLVDLFCLGVKDAYFEAGVAESALREFVEERLPGDCRERIHPACAKKMIERAVDYAQSLGFAPHRDFRKGRKVLSGLDSALCPRDFACGREGRPCYIRGPDDSDERVNRVLAILEARCGADGFDYEDPADDAEEDFLAVREELMAFLDAEPEEVPRFYEVSGLITALLAGPTVFSPLRVFDALWGPAGGREWKDPAEAREIAELLVAYWNQLNDLVQDALRPDAPADAPMIDVWVEDFEDSETGGRDLVAANFAWAQGFLRATEVWPEAWGDALTRPDLAPHWEVVGWWAGFEQKENQDRMIAAAKATPPRTLNTAVKDLARALRPQ